MREVFIFTMKELITNKKSFALTTPLYYVNDVPHIGSAYTTIAADVRARFERLRGKPVLLITGTDEHGQKIERTARSANRSPQEYCDEIAASFETLWKKLDIDYDRFSRTTAHRHEAIVKEFFQRVWDKGDIYLGRQQGWYCVSCEEFKEERDLLEGHRCAIHLNKEAEWRDEQNYFFRLSNYQKQLETLYQQHPDFIQPESRRNEVLNFVERGLQDFSISRVNVEWGFPMPTDPNQTLYVWFDALLGYVTALLEPEDEPTLANATAKWWPINLHLIGKDILRFHTIYWPAMLMSAGLPLPDCIFGHGFLTKDGRKMGKSLGNTLDPISLVDQYGADAVRYYFLKEIEFGQDGDFNETRFINILNADLANDLGNLLNRTLGMARKYCNAHVPALENQEISEDHPLKAIGLTLGKTVATAYETLDFSTAAEACLSLTRACNKYIDEQAPWSLYKQGKQQEVNQVLYSVLESVRLAAYLLSPLIPNISSDIYRQLGFEVDLKAQQSLKRSPQFAPPIPAISDPDKISNAVISEDFPRQDNALIQKTQQPDYGSITPTFLKQGSNSKVFQPFFKAPLYFGEFFKQYKRPVVLGGLLLVTAGVGGIILQIVDRIDDIPVIAPTLELIGIGYTSWFLLRYVMLSESRQALSQTIQSLSDSIFNETQNNQSLIETKTLGIPTQEVINSDVVPQLSVPFEIHAGWGILPPNQPLGQAKPVFQRIEQPESASL